MPYMHVQTLTLSLSLSLPLSLSPWRAARRLKERGTASARMTDPGASVRMLAPAHAPPCTPMPTSCGGPCRSVSRTCTPMRGHVSICARSRYTRLPLAPSAPTRMHAGPATASRYGMWVTLQHSNTRSTFTISRWNICNIYLKQMKHLGHNVLSLFCSILFASLLDYIIIIEPSLPFPCLCAYYLLLNMINRILLIWRESSLHTLYQNLMTSCK
jgi:hypothetical protein